MPTLWPLNMVQSESVTVEHGIVLQLVWCIYFIISSHIIFAYIIIYIRKFRKHWEGESFPQFISRLQVDIFLSLDLFGQLLGDVTSRWCSRRPCHVYEAPLPPDTKVFTRFTGWSGSPVRVPLSFCFFLFRILSFGQVWAKLGGATSNLEDYRFIWVATNM